MQKLKCDRGLLKHVGNLLLRRNYVSRTRNLYEVLGLSRGATAVRKLNVKSIFSLRYDADFLCRRK